MSGIQLLGVLLPTIALLLHSSQQTSTSLHSQTVTQLLFFATSAPVAFKEAAGHLDQITRELLQTSVKLAVESSSLTSGVNSAKPQISLRSF